MEDVRQRLGEWGLTELEIVFSGEIQLKTRGSGCYRTTTELIRIFLLSKLASENSMGIIWNR